jgi:hypothetical protein
MTFASILFFCVRTFVMRSKHAYQRALYVSASNSVHHAFCTTASQPALL